MIRVTNQYIWNLVFLIFFCVLLVVMMIILDNRVGLKPADLNFLDITLMVLATWRLVRLFLFDTITKWFREQFWNCKKTQSGESLEKPARGARRTIADLLSCPWCFGTWAAAFVVFFYLLTPIAFYPVLLLAVSAVATLLHHISCFLTSKIKTLN